MGRCSGCRWVYGRVTFVASFLQRIYTITGEDAFACSLQQKCIKEEEEGDTHWDKLQPCTRPAVAISPARHDEILRVVER